MMKITQKKTCNLCKALHKAEGTDPACLWGYSIDQESGSPLEPCPKPLTQADFQSSMLKESHPKISEGQPALEPVGNTEDTTSADVPAIPSESEDTDTVVPVSKEELSVISECMATPSEIEDVSLAKCFLIDTENVGRDWIPFVLRQEPNTRYLLFCTSRSPTIPLAMFPALAQVSESIEIIECFHTGVNALDFQLVSLLGNLLAEAPEKKYIIVADDRGYNAVVKFWRLKGYDVSRYVPPHIDFPPKDAVVESTPCQASKPNFKKANAEAFCREEYASQLSNAGLEESIATEVAAAIVKNVQKPEGERKAAIHTALAHLYGQADGSKIYKAYKPIIANICRNGPFPSQFI